MPIFTTHSELWKVLFLSPSVSGFLLVYEISLELLNGFVPNSHGRHLDPHSDDSEGQGNQRQKTTLFGPFGKLRAVYVW